MNTRRNARIYWLMMLVIIALGLPSRTMQAHLPSWYVQYFGDYLWAMLLFFGFALILQKSNTLQVAMTTLVFTYCIEISQLFHPPWLEYLRSIKLFALLLGYNFLWADLVTYALGIFTGALIEHLRLQIVSFRPT